MSAHTPKVFVFCNSGLCAEGKPVRDHAMVALAEDGAVLAGHICSSHAHAIHDMGVAEDGWKRDKYAAHYPGGFDVEFVDDIDTHDGIRAAFAKMEAA